ncbi:MAG: hypothetical protein ACE5GM_07150 [bacterium]
MGIEVEAGSPPGPEIRGIMDKGGLIPDGQPEDNRGGKNLGKQITAEVEVAQLKLGLVGVFY